MDDFYLVVNTGSADMIISEFARILSEYRLTLNENKVNVYTM